MQEIRFRDLVLAVGLITGFVFFISIAVFYTYSLLQSEDYCTCTETIPIVIIIVASLGLFVGSFAYYYLMDRIVGKYRKNSALKKALVPFLGLLEKKEREIVQKLIESKKLNQAELGRIAGLDRVQVTRVLQKLEEKNFVKRTRKGKTNLIELSKDVSQLFK